MVVRANSSATGEMLTFPPIEKVMRERVTNNGRDPLEGCMICLEAPEEIYRVNCCMKFICRICWRRKEVNKKCPFCRWDFDSENLPQHARTSELAKIAIQTGTISESQSLPQRSISVIRPLHTRPSQLLVLRRRPPFSHAPATPFLFPPPVPSRRPPFLPAPASREMVITILSPNRDRRLSVASLVSSSTEASDRRVDVPIRRAHLLPSPIRVTASQDSPSINPPTPTPRPERRESSVSCTEIVVTTGLCAGSIGMAVYGFIYSSMLLTITGGLGLICLLFFLYLGRGATPEIANNEDRITDRAHA